MFLSVAVSKAEVASSRSNNFGDLRIKNIYTRYYFRKYCSCTEKMPYWQRIVLVLCRFMFKNMQTSQSYVGTGHWALSTEHWALDTGYWAWGTGQTNLRKVLAIATLCFSPPLSFRPRSPTFVS